MNKDGFWFISFILSAISLIAVALTSIITFVGYKDFTNSKEFVFMGITFGVLTFLSYYFGNFSNKQFQELNNLKDKEMKE